jgi:hypothetical protein
VPPAQGVSNGLINVCGGLCAVERSTWSIGPTNKTSEIKTNSTIVTKQFRDLLFIEFSSQPVGKLAFEARDDVTEVLERSWIK